MMSRQWQKTCVSRDITEKFTQENDVELSFYNKYWAITELQNVLTNSIRYLDIIKSSLQGK